MTSYLKTGFLYLGAITILILSLHYFQNEISGIMEGKDIASENWYRLSLRLHIVFGIVAIFLGPSQFINRFRTKYIKWHRTTGYAYFGSVVLSSLSGLVVAQFATGGRISSIGFSIQSILWFGVTTAAFMAIANKKIERHRLLMFLSYALTFTAITQRAMLLVPQVTGMEYMPVYQLSAWLPWMINLTLAYYFYSQTKSSLEINPS